MTNKKDIANHRTIAGAPKQLTPLWIIALFLSFAETVGGLAVIRTTGATQTVFTCFVVVFPVLIACAFFVILWKRPEILLSPSDFRETDVAAFVRAIRGETPRPQRGPSGKKRESPKNKRTSRKAEKKRPSKEIIPQQETP